jgi:hypothetical protein
MWVGLTSLGRADPTDFAWDGTNETVRGSGYELWCSRVRCDSDNPFGGPCGYAKAISAFWETIDCDTSKLSVYMIEYDCD